jgi:hypothetical protein
MVLVKYNLHRLGETNQPRRGEYMIRQTVLPFKLKRTEERATARSGLAIYAEFFRAMGVVLKEIGLVIAYEFKEGNDNGGRAEILKKAFSKMPEGKRIEEVLLDAEYYSHEVIEYLEERGVR